MKLITAESWLNEAENICELLLNSQCKLDTRVLLEPLLQNLDLVIENDKKWSREIQTCFWIKGYIDSGITPDLFVLLEKIKSAQQEEQYVLNY